MIVVWYNPHKDDYYAKYVRSAYFHSYYKVGYINQYEHKIIAMFIIINNKPIKCDSLNDYYYNKKSLRKRIILNIINFLERRV